MRSLFLKLILLIAVIWLMLSLTCCRTCPPAKDIMNGKAAEKHDRRKFHSGMIRVNYTRQFGKTCKVQYENKQEVIVRLYDSCDCNGFQVGKWVKRDSI